MKKRSIKLCCVAVVLCCLPILKIGGSYISVQEFLIYILFILHIANFGTIRSNYGLGHAYSIYGILFLISIIIVSISSNSLPNSYDIYILRQIFQFSLLFYLFEFYYRSHPLGKSEYHFFLLLITYPSIIGFLKIYGPTSVVNLLDTVYFSEFGYLDASNFDGNRTSSVFKSFFNASTYYVFAIICLVSLVFSSLREQHTLRVYPLFLCAIIILSSFLTGRTAILFGLFSMIIFIVLGLFHSSTRIFSLSLLALGVSCGAYSLYHIASAGIDISWALEFVFLFTGDAEKFSSFADMGNMNIGFLKHLSDGNYRIFWQPNHTYDLSYVKDSHYTDSFYLQEIYRYGVYGILAKLIFIGTLFYFCIKARVSQSAKIFMMVWFSMFVILNYKGGSTFTMERNIYYYAVFGWFLIKYLSEVCVKNNFEHYSRRGGIKI